MYISTPMSASNSNDNPKNRVNTVVGTFHDGGSVEKEIVIAVMGATGSGKTSFINFLSGSNLRVGRGLQSCTSVVQAALPFELDGRRVLLIDMPGFDDTTRSDVEILKMIAHFLATTYTNGIRLSGVIYMHRISDFRMGGISRRNFNMFRQLCGESYLKNVVLVTNMWSEVTIEVGEAREAELRESDIFFKPVLDKHARLLRHENTLQSAQAVIRNLIGNRPMALRIQRELVDQHLDITQTGAGAVLNQELMEQLSKHQGEVRDLQLEMKAAITVKDEETRKELERETRKLQAEMARVQADAQKLASDYNQEKVRMEKQMQAIADTSKDNAERAAAGQRRQLAELSRHLQQAADASAAHKDAMQRQITDLQRGYETIRNNSGGGGGLFGQIGRIIDTLLKFI